MAFFPRLQAQFVCCTFLAAAAVMSCRAADERTVSSGEIDRIVLATLSHQGAIQPKVIRHIDLTRPFGTKTQWTSVVVEEEQPLSEMDDHGPVHVCLVNGRVPDCSENPYKQISKEQVAFDAPYQLLAASVVQAGTDHSLPLLFMQICSARSINGNCGIATALYRYERGTDRFVRLFQNMTGRNNNEATRFVEQGPLRGDVIVDYPTENAPYTYWIEVYRANESGSYVRVLRYRGKTHYGDGNSLAVADSEMPAILSHLGLWKRGDALPVPPHMPRACSRLYMQREEEWCK